jgi:hypothetical protein
MRRSYGRGFTHAGYVKTGQEVYACKLTDMSLSGATLSFASPIDLPDHFTVQLTRDGHVTRNCTVAWNDGVQVGVVFGINKER